MRVGVRFNSGPTVVHPREIYMDMAGIQSMDKLSIPAWVFTRHSVFSETLNIKFDAQWQRRFTWDGFLRDMSYPPDSVPGRIAVGSWVFHKEALCAA